MKKRLLFGLVLILLLTALVGCGSQDSSNGTEAQPDTNFSKFDLNTEYDSTDVTTITLAQGKSTTDHPEQVKIESRAVTITAPGTYFVSGEMTNGMLIVAVKKTEKVHIVFSGVRISSKQGAAFHVKSADKVCVTLAEGTENVLQDASSYLYASTMENVPTACMYSQDDLTINGTGTLRVTGSYNNGIASKDDLKIVSGTIEVTAIKNAIKGKKSIKIRDGNITVTTASGDAFKSDATKEGQGNIYVYGGSIHLTAADDGFQASNEVVLYAGTVTAIVGDKLYNATTYDVFEACTVITQQ